MKDTWRFGDYTISTDKRRLDLPLIHGFLSTSYWAEGRSEEIVRTSLEHSLCFGVYREEEQVGFARVISDYATLAYLADVFVLEPHRKRALGKRLIETALTMSRFATVAGRSLPRMHTVFTSSTASSAPRTLSGSCGANP